MQACFTKTLIIVLFIQADFFLLLVFLRVIDSEISIWIEMTKLSGICCPEPIHSFMQDLHTVMHHGDDKPLPLHRRILTSSSYCNPHYKAGRRQQVSCGKDSGLPQGVAVHLRVEYIKLPTVVNSLFFTTISCSTCRTTRSCLQQHPVLRHAILQSCPQLLDAGKQEGAWWHTPSQW